jgi:hypothetical protein
MLSMSAYFLILYAHFAAGRVPSGTYLVKVSYGSNVLLEENNNNKIGGSSPVHRHFVRFHPEKTAVHVKIFGNMKTASYIWSRFFKYPFRTFQTNFKKRIIA